MNIENTSGCKKCNGTGGFLYTNTATWRSRPGMVSGRAMTTDVCDMCWGSGDECSPGPNLREKSQEHHRIG